MPSTAIIIPCYNEADRLDTDAFVSFTRSNPSFRFLFVDDGSTDETRSVILKMSKKAAVEYLFLKENHGKAEAVRRGCIHAIDLSEEYNYVGFLDADLATPLDELPRFLRVLETNRECQIVLGSRWQRLGSKISRNPLRHFLGRVFATFVSNYLKMSVYDTQCGAKLMRSSIVKEVFDKAFISKWFFDVEILRRLTRVYNPKDDSWAIEIPLSSWSEVGGSKIKITDFIKAPWELVKIARHYG